MQLQREEQEMCCPRRRRMLGLVPLPSHTHATVCTQSRCKRVHSLCSEHDVHSPSKIWRNLNLLDSRDAYAGNTLGGQ